MTPRAASRRPCTRRRWVGADRRAHHHRLFRGADRAGDADVPETWELLQYLCDQHQFVYQHLADELLWATSMPCAIDGDASIPIAQFGPSNVGRLKTIYREASASATGG